MDFKEGELVRIITWDEVKNKTFCNSVFFETNGGKKVIIKHIIFGGTAVVCETKDHPKDKFQVAINKIKKLKFLEDNLFDL